MARYTDSRKAGRSKVVPYIPGETADMRHARRLGTAIKTEAELRQWCDDNGWTLKINNGAYHWAFRRGDTFVDWWPNTAKLVINKQWKRGIHCHDYQQVIGFLEKNTRRDK